MTHRALISRGGEGLVGGDGRRGETTMKKDAMTARRVKVLEAARWCFINFGFSKTSLEDIAKRADLSRTLLYRIFSNKEDIYRAVFTDWLVSRHPAAKEAVRSSGTVYERLLTVCRLMLIEPWEEMVSAPMGGEFLEACERIHPETSALHRSLVLESVTTLLGDASSAEVFLLALDGQLADQPSTEVLEQRTKLLAERFASATPTEVERP